MRGEEGKAKRRREKGEGKTKDAFRPGVASFVPPPQLHAVHPPLLGFSQI